MTEPVCRWCRKTEAEHKPASAPNRMKARCPCLMWRELFVPTTPTVPPRLNSVAALSVLGHSAPQYETELRLDQLDALRLAVVAEIWKLHTESGRIHMDQTITEYARLVKERAR